ncbi:MAG: SRPBCC family protein [Sphingosinicella sp.]
MITFAFLAALALQAPPADLRPEFEPLRFLIGHCWQGQFASGETDTHCFEPVYGGQHVRDRHEVTGGRGLYRGETLYSAEPGGVTFTYWNSRGGVSRGTLRAAPGWLDFGEETYRGPDGRTATISNHWRRVGDDAYEAVTASAQMPSMNRTVTYRRVSGVTVLDERAPDGSITLVHQGLVAAPAGDIWTAITTAEGWRGWAVPRAWMHGENELETSYSPGAQPGDPNNIRQRMLVRVPGRLLAFHTIRAPAGFPHFDTFTRVTSVIELVPLDERHTRVRILGAGYPENEAGRALLGFFREGNRVSLERLQQRFLTGPIDWSREPN